MAQIISITSEALQATIRRLLPSQQGFGEDLQASNVVQPIIDLTPSAEGSEFRADLQTALSLGSNTAFEANGSTDTFINTPGFYRLFGNMYSNSDASFVGTGTILITDGTTTKNLVRFRQNEGTGATGITQGTLAFDFVVFVRAGEELRAVSNTDTMFIDGTVRQIADVSGNLVNPVGFTAS